MFGGHTHHALSCLQITSAPPLFTWAECARFPLSVQRTAPPPVRKRVATLGTIVAAGLEAEGMERARAYCSTWKNEDGETFSFKSSSVSVITPVPSSTCNREITPVPSSTGNRERPGRRAA